MAADCRAVETTPSLIVAHSAPFGEDIWRKRGAQRAIRILAHDAQMVGLPCGAASWLPPAFSRRLLRAVAREPPERRLQPGLAAPLPAAHCPRKILRVVMPLLISTCSVACRPPFSIMMERSEEHTSELQSLRH